MAEIAVIGLGYVGLPLSLQFARAGVTVLGLDIDAAKVTGLNAGRSYIGHIPAAAIREALEGKRFSASADFARVREVGAVLICVPTPLKDEREPDISYILKTGEAIAPHLQRGVLVVLESTTYPGTTEDELRDVLERGCGGRAGDHFHLAYSPERVDPGQSVPAMGDIPKVVGGFTAACCAAAERLYARAFRRVVPVSSCRAAETVKLLENIFRSVNIALVNELKPVCAAMETDIWEVIAAAATKPFGFMPFYPGPGLGGHCIPIDPFYLAWKARQCGQRTRLIELAGEINTAMPARVVARVEEALRARGQSLAGARVLVLGLAYKPDVDDVRESPGFALMTLLRERGAAVAYHDPHVPVIKPMREHGQWTGTQSVAWERKIISAFDAVLICTAHRGVNYSELAAWSECIIDTRNVMASVAARPGTVWKA